MKFMCGAESHGEICIDCQWDECVNWDHYNFRIEYPESETEYQERTKGGGR